jgi:hypothetical protein
MVLLLCVCAFCHFIKENISEVKHTFKFNMLNDNDLASALVFQTYTLTYILFHSPVLILWDLYLVVASSYGTA